MTQEEKIWIASIAVAKSYNYETLKHSDYMYGNEDLTEDVYEYVTEAEQIGTIAFKEKYKNFKLY